MSFFFFKQKTAYEMRISDWSSDVCSSDLPGDGPTDLAIQHGSPRHERELPTLLHEHKPSAGKIHPTQQSALNRFPGAHLDEGLAQLASQFVASTKEFASLQHHDRDRKSTRLNSSH